MHLTENFRKSVYEYFIQNYFIKSPLASTTASILDQNFL
jgi:hypothetical protein